MKTSDGANDNTRAFGLAEWDRMSEDDRKAIIAHRLKRDESQGGDQS